MPELAEVEAYRQSLSAFSEGGLLREPHFLEGQRLKAWERHGKRLFLPFESGGGARIQLGMTGKLVKRTMEDEADRFERMRLVFRKENASYVIAFLDRRRLGSLEIVPSREAAFEGLGPDALSLKDGAEFAAALKAKGQGRKLKDVLMDQALVAGLGNIAAIEMCFRARIHPLRALSSLEHSDFERLCGAMHAHLAHALSDALSQPEPVYVSDGGPNPFYVYGRLSEPCPACSRPLSRALHAQRPTYWCERCQPSP